MAKLQQTLSTASQAVQAELNNVAFGLRYGNPVKALEALDKIISDPGLTEPQKKAVNEAIEKVKKQAAEQPPPPASQ